jgi:putative Ca2+/H+ antiporter (TMEM165/GDT1 family)
MLIPDKLDEGDSDSSPRLGVFGTTVIAFFLAEMGDQTQIATVMLAARYPAWFAVVAGATLGMMLADAPVAWFGDRITRRVPLRVMHIVSALIFAAMGLAALFWGRAVRRDPCRILDQRRFAPACGRSINPAKDRQPAAWPRFLATPGCLFSR